MSYHAQIFSDRIDWSDLDLLGHVNNVAITRFLQAARVDYLNHTGLDVVPCMKKGPILAASSVRYLVQLFFPGTVRVLTRVKSTKNTSFVLEHALYDDKGNIAALAEEVLVYFDFAAQTKIPLTKEIRSKMTEYEESCSGEYPVL